MRCIVLVLIPGTTLLSLTHLHLEGVVESFSGRVDKPWTFVHRFLAAFPNFETPDRRLLRVTPSRLDYLDPHNDYKDLLVVMLPRLCHLSVDGHALATVTARVTLRLHILSAFVVTACAGTDQYDCDFYLIPQTLSESIHPIRRSRYLSFVVGGCTNDITLRGGPGAAFSNEEDWSNGLPAANMDSALSLAGMIRLQMLMGGGDKVAV